ncbi:MAG TPA: DUF4384 domain-containing protein [Blastocatellia bacterium]|nr:DUF4384 domain-containing protein [Blastocatellia bacterium]
MKALIRFAMISLAIAGLTSIVALTQKVSAQRDTSGVRTRAIRMKYETGKVDGMRIIVYLMDGDKALAVDPSRSFKKGDQIKIEFESNFDGYVYFVNVAPSGKSAVIYPDRRAGETNNMIRERQRYVLPHSAPFEFDEEKGTEVLQVIMSRRAVPLFEDAIRNSRGELGTTASTAAAELMGVESKRSGIDTANTQRILPPEMRARSVRLAPAGNNDEKGTVIAVPDTKLKPGEVAVFEIRLRHV